MAQAAGLVLVVGSTGAGKTTYARALAERIGAMRFSIDEWMMALFWKDSPQPIRFDWTIERVGRCEALIFRTASEAAMKGMPAVLDLGFTTREQRDRFRTLAAGAGLSATIHYIDVNPQERWRRVQQRNAAQGTTYAFEVNRSMFDFMELRWEPPRPAELAESGGVRIGPDGAPIGD